jgi:hypothetical protein
MLATKIKAKIKKNRKVTISVPDIPPGDVEIIILREEKIIQETNKLDLIPRHRVGKIYNNLTRNTFYIDAR